MQTALEQQKSLEINNMVNQILDFSEQHQEHKDRIARVHATMLDISLAVMERFKAMRVDGHFTVEGKH